MTARIVEYSISLDYRLSTITTERERMRNSAGFVAGSDNELTAQIANLRTRIERMKARNE